MSTPWNPRLITAHERIFAVGDIHGCFDELVILLDFLDRYRGSNDSLVFIGDYIDRGPASKAVVDLLINRREHDSNVVFLKGNHEAMLLDYLDKPRSIEHPYLKHGGMETFVSYGGDFASALEKPHDLIPPAHRRFFDQLELGATSPGYLFVHAGVEPSLPLEAQEEEHLLWSQDQFLARDHTLEFTVVHGHTPFQDVSIRRGVRIGIDTGLVYGNLLTCIELPKGIVHQIGRGATTVSSRTT